MTIPKISPTGVAPSRNRPATFRQEGDAFFANIEQKFEPELNAAIDAMNETFDTTDSNVVAAMIASQNADAAQQIVASVVAATPWVSGTTYSINSCAISQVNFQTYRKRTTSTGGTTDPANDSTNWRLLAGNGAFVPTAVAASSIDLRMGNYFTKTVSANTTFTFDFCPPDGYSFTLEVNHTGGTIVFPTSVKTPGDIAYTLTAGKTHLFMFVTTNGGTRWRLVSATNYTT